MFYLKKNPWISPAWMASIIISLALSAGFFSLFCYALKLLPITEANGLSAIEPKQMDYFWRSNFYHRTLDRETVLQFKEFYDLLVKISPQYSVDNEGILAFCEYYSGNTPRAITLFGLVAQEEPTYFWYAYDLSILYIQTHQYAKAITSLRHALQLDPTSSLEILYDSPGFWVLTGGNKDKAQLFSKATEDLRRGYTLASALLNILTEEMKNRGQQSILKSLNLDLYVF